MGLFSKFFGSSKPIEFDARQEAQKVLKELAPCATHVVIASPRYSGTYRADVVAEAAVLADFFEMLFKSTTGGNQVSQVVRLAMPAWLRAGAQQSWAGPSYLPQAFYDEINPRVQDFVSRGQAAVYCPDCQAVVPGVNAKQHNMPGSGLRGEWTNEWRCPKNHLLYLEDHEIHWVRRTSD